VSGRPGAPHPGLAAARISRALNDAGIPCRSASASSNNVRAALEIARQCRTLPGASGITLEYPVLRHASNLESVLTYEGTAEVHQLAVGKAVTGYSAFRLAAGA
jgi:glutaryl-CoA dehydrogenase